MNFLTVYLEQFLQGTWAQNVGWTLLHSLWQIALIAVLYAVAVVGLRNRSASLRYLLGCVAMAAMLVVPVATFCVLPRPLEPVDIEIVVSPTVRSSDLPETGLAVGQQGQAVTSPPITQTMFDPDFASKASDMFIVEQPALLERVTLSIRPWLPIATVAWLLGVLLLSLRPVLGCLRVQSLRRKGLTPLSESHCQLAQQLVERLGIGHVVQFAQSALVEVPTVIGYLRPMVLLPASSVTGLTTAELELILAHELAHIRRHDYALNLIQTVIEALLFYHPGMWWVSSHVRRERENCCDDVAVAIRGDRATYIRALAQLEEHRIVPPALGASGSSLLMRVRRLLDQPQSEFGYRKSSIWLTALILSVSLTVAAFAGSLSGGTSDPPGENSAEVTPAKGDDVSGDVDSELNFEKQVGQRVAQVIRKAELPFVDEQRLADIEADFAQFMSLKIPFGTYKLGSSIPAEQRKAILSAIEQHGAQHLGIDRYRPSDLRSINGAYLGLPDRLLTLKWKLHQAIIHTRTFDAGKEAKLEDQRAWMKQHIRSLPVDKYVTHQTALSELEERFADSLACTLGFPMDDEQFGIFQQKLKKYASDKSEVRHVVSHIVQQSLFAKYLDSDIPLPFKDQVLGKGAGRFVHLSFMSNRPFESSLRSIDDIENSHTVIDATTGYLVTAPKGNRKAENFERWLNDKKKGDFGFDDANGGGLFAVRNAKLVKLDVRTWVEADAIGNDALRALLDGPTAGRTVSLKKHYQDYQQDNDAPYCYVGVLTKEGGLAVVAVEDFSGGSSTLLRTRVRSTLPELITEELSDGEVTLSFDHPTNWFANDSFQTGVGQNRTYRQPFSEVKGTHATLRVQFRNERYPYNPVVREKPSATAIINKVLTIAGEPARMTSDRFPDSSGEMMDVIFGKGTFRYQLTFVYPTSQRKQYVELALAVCKSIRIRATDDEMEKIVDPAAGPSSRKSTFKDHFEVSKEFADGADRAETARKFAAIAKKAPIAMHSHDRVIELADLLAEMSEQNKPVLKTADGVHDTDALDSQIDQLVWSLRNLVKPAFGVPGKVRVIANASKIADDPNNPALKLFRLAQTPEHRNHVVERLIAMLEDRRPTRSWAGSMNGGHFYRNADVALEILDHVAFKERPYTEYLHFYKTDSLRDAYFTTADENTRQEIVARVKSWWKSQLDKQSKNSQLDKQSKNNPDTSATTAELSAHAKAYTTSGDLTIKADNDPRAKFLAIERFARLPDEKQADQLSKLYRKLSPAYLNPFLEWSLSSTPRSLLKPASGPYDGNTQRWGTELADVASKKNPEQVADQLGHWLGIAARARAIYVFQRHPEATAALIAADLDSLDPPAVDRAAKAILALNLREFTQRLVTIFIDHEKVAEPAFHTLLFLKDPACTQPLLDQVPKDPSFLIRCNGIFQSVLQDKLAVPTLLGLLNSPDAEIKYAAASALTECRDKKLAAPAAELAGDREARFRRLAAEMAVKLPDDTFKTIRANLIPLLKDANGPVKMAALRCFSQQHDLAAGPVILKMLKEKASSVQDKVTVMQSLSQLAGTNFNYDLHNWGPSNTRPIRKFENWLNQTSAQFKEKLNAGENIVVDATLEFLTNVRPDSDIKEPKKLGREFADADVQNDRKRILYYGEPWSQSKPLIDDETGYPVVIVAGSNVTKGFVELVGEYNSAINKHFKGN